MKTTEELYKKIETFEMFHFNRNKLTDLCSGNGEWNERYLQNDFYQRDHLVSTALNSETKFLIWDHIGHGGGTNSTHKKRCETFAIQNGFTLKFQRDDLVLICVIGISNAIPSLEEFLEVEQDSFKELIEALDRSYKRKNYHEIWKNIPRTYSKYQKGKLLSTLSRG